ncbi:MAG: hypothetical protein AVDCRST_MAG40-2202, partial [uncultured Gemmatimonadaceae bacterium]
GGGGGRPSRGAHRLHHLRARAPLARLRRAAGRGPRRDGARAAPPARRPRRDARGHGRRPAPGGGVARRHHARLRRAALLARRRAGVERGRRPLPRDPAPTPGRGAPGSRPRRL